MNSKFLIFVFVLLALLAQESSARSIQSHLTASQENQSPMHITSDTVAGNILSQPIAMIPLAIMAIVLSLMM